MWWFKIRPSVRRFAEMMEMRLRMYDEERGKLGWLYPKIAHPAWLMGRADEELLKVQHALDKRAPGHNWRTEVITESLDVANFMMMLADVMIVRSSYERSNPYGDCRNCKEQL